jgi:DNA polymerase-3 subunit epsilon
MIVVGLDLETTGLDKAADRPIEVGLTLWSTKYNRSLETHNFLVQSDGVPVPPEVTEITGIDQMMADSGKEPSEAYEEVEYFVSRAQAIVAFNGRRFDIPMMQAWAARLGKTFPNKFVIDPYEDTPAKSDAASPGMRPQELITMCAKEGIYYDAHEAGADVSAMLKLMSKRPFNFVLDRAKSPVVVLQSKQGRNENHLAKQHKFRWQPDYKIWWKPVKTIDRDILMKQIGGAFTVIDTGYTVEELDSNDR